MQSSHRHRIPSLQAYISGADETPRPVVITALRAQTPHFVSFFHSPSLSEMLCLDSKGSAYPRVTAWAPLSAQCS